MKGLQTIELTWNLFHLTNNSTFANFSNLIDFQTQEGIVPVNEFENKYNFVRLDKRPIFDGILPFNKLEYKSKDSMLARFPSSMGKVPLMKLENKNKRARLDRLPISDGILPCNKFCAKSR